MNARVMHARHAPKNHKLNYGLWYLCCDLGDLPQLDKLKLFSRNRPNLFSLFDRDYGIDKAQTMSDWINHIKTTYDLVEADGPITLVTMPRLLMYAFNPVSFWFLKDRSGAIRAVLVEVNNTFGERHCYLCRHEDRRAIISSDWLSREKVFHVSPFMKVSGDYDFRFKLTGDELGVWINYNDDIGQGRQRMLSTSLTGHRADLDNYKVFIAFFRYPLVTVKVIAMIHWHAIKILLKGIRYIPKPKPPADMVT